MAMNMSNASGDAEVMVDINTTPLIDVMLVLLIMLIITIPIQTHAVKLNMPVGASAAPPVLPRVIRVDVEADGKVLWNGEMVADRASLEAKLQAVVQSPDQAEVHLRPHKGVKYEPVMMVMASAQRLGVKKLGVVGNEQFAD